MRFLIKFSYDGSNYHGYQCQKGLDTVQERIESAIKTVNNDLFRPVISTGRTDKGVHAKEQYAHVDLDVNINEYQLKRALNSNLPEDIHIVNTKIVSDKFHARYHVVEKEYEYLINLGEYDPIMRNYIYQYNYKLDIDKMSDAIQHFVGTHDFRAFVTENKDKLNCIRTITKVEIKNEYDEVYSITFKGSGFLRYQVRNMVGILLKVGQRKKTPKEMLEILESKDRSKCGVTAPAVGLYLTKVKFDDSID